MWPQNEMFHSNNITNKSSAKIFIIKADILTNTHIFTTFFR